MADLSAIPTEELMRMRGAPAGGSGADLSQMSTEELMRMRGSSGDAPKAIPEKRSLTWDDIKSAARPEAPVEVGAALASGTIGQLLGRSTAVAKGLFGGGMGTQEGAQAAQATGGKVAEALTYQPRGEFAQDAMRTVGHLMDKSKLAGMGPTEAIALGGVPVGSIGNLVAGAKSRAQTGANTISGLIRKPEPEMIGMGAASTSPEAIRRARASDLPVPVQLTKGQATRDFEQQRFERETSKSATTGEPLRQRYAKQNEDIIKNFDSWIDETGAQAPSLRATGNAVDDALVAKVNFAKAKIRDAYDQAKKSGEMSAFVDTTPILNFINENASAAKLAPVIQAVENELIRLGGATRTEKGILFADKMSINDVETVRKLVTRLSKTDDTNGHYGGLANKVIDAMTEGQGGEKYKAARQLYKDYAAEFKNQGVIRKLVSTKPGTTDRAVAFEDVFNHSILAGSRDDVAAVLKSLEGAGDKGRTAIAELKGATMAYLRDEAMKNSARDTLGNPILSYDKLNKAVRELERDGKLDLVFGKKGAEQVRDITELVADVHTAPPGTINFSNTGAVLLDALGDLATGRLTTATAKAVGVIKEQVGNRKINRRVRDSLAEPEMPVVERPMMH